MVRTLRQGSRLRRQDHPIAVHNVAVGAGAVGISRVLATSLRVHVVREGRHWWRFVLIL